jgi:DNA-binding LacI/PurR family transcriptional regulator
MSGYIFSSLQINPQSDISLISQLTQQISWLIASRELNAGDKLPPIRDLADQLGIHMHTVRQAYQRLEEDGLVSAVPRRGTEVLPYNPDVFASGSSERTSFLLGVILPNPVSFYSPFIRSIQEATRDLRYIPIFCYTYENPYLVETYVNQLLTRQVDGIILTSLSLPSILENPERLESYPPIVSVDMPDMPGYRVLLETENAAFQVTKHLIDHGYQRIGLIIPPLEWPNVMPFYQGYERALIEIGLKPNLELIALVDGFGDNFGNEGTTRLLTIAQPPQAIVAAADSLALGAMDAIYEHGLSIPKDIALVGYNDIPAASLIHPGLTTSTVPAAEMGSLALEILQELLAGKTPPHLITTVPTELVLRQSCGC